MNNTIKLLTRNKVLAVSFFFSILSLLFAYISDSGRCTLQYKQCESIAYNLMIFIPVFLTGILFSKISEQNYNSWMKFISVWIPISLFLIVMSPVTREDLSPIYKKTVFLIMCSGLILGTLCILLYRLVKKS